MRVRFRPQGERAFPLESRHLCTAAAVAAPTTPPIVQDLGLVGPQLAETGLRATATISEGSSVAFRLVLKQGGDFVLFFKHEGPAGVTLKAQTPGGEADLDPGPAGSFEAARLQLPAGEYVLTPSNTGPGSLFVDWDLVLANGIGQEPAAMLRLTDATPVAPSSALAPTPPLAVSYNTAGAKGRKLSRNLILRFSFSCISECRGSPRIERFPRARGPNSIRPWNQPITHPRSSKLAT